MTQIITLANKGMIPLTDNLIRSIGKAGMRNQIYVVCSDKYVYRRYNNYASIMLRNVFMFMSDIKGNKTKYCEYGTKSFRNIYMQKFPGIKKILEGTKQDVIFIDSDCVILKDFNNYFKNVDADILSSLEYDGTYCCGFMYFRNTQSTLDFIDLHIRMSSKRVNFKKYFDDQSIFNEMCNRNICETKIAPLPESLFCNGNYIQNNKINENMYIVHANCIRGIDKKIELLKELGLYNETN